MVRSNSQMAIITRASGIAGNNMEKVPCDMPKMETSTLVIGTTISVLAWAL